MDIRVDRRMSLSRQIEGLNLPVEMRVCEYRADRRVNVTGRERRVCVYRERKCVWIQIDGRVGVRQVDQRM